MKQLIINADDFALTPGVSRGIIEAHSNGIVTSTSLMTNSPYFEEAVSLLKENRSLDVGVHLNATWEAPILPKHLVSSLLDKNGKFFKKPHLIPDNINLKEMKAELEAQLNKALSTGLQISHLDTHHHLHASRPDFFQLLIDLATFYQLPLRTLDDDSRDKLFHLKIPTPHYFIGTFFGRTQISQPVIESLLAKIPKGVTELMCHPGFSDKSLAEESSYVEERQIELNLLTDSSLKEWLAANNIQLVNFKIFAFKGAERVYKMGN